jgi:hypothetical protein
MSELLQFIIVVAFGALCFGCGYLTAFIVTRNRWRDEMIKLRKQIGRLGVSGDGGKRPTLPCIRKCATLEARQFRFRRGALLCRTQDRYGQIGCVLGPPANNRRFFNRAARCSKENTNPAHAR